nr:MAG TPA: hypothetical protein [Caudoviricetes sp.]
MPGFRLLSPLLIARLSPDAAAYVAAQPAEQRGVGELRRVFEERPQLHAAREAREEPRDV